MIAFYKKSKYMNTFIHQTLFYRRFILGASCLDYMMESEELEILVPITFTYGFFSSFFIL